MKNFEACKYTYLHRKALFYYIKNCNLLSKNIKNELLKRATIHDMDKLILYLFWDKEKAHNWHVEHSSHHISKLKQISDIDYLESIFDYECAALTKPDKPLNAYDTIIKYYNEFYLNYEPFLKILNMNSSYCSITEEALQYMIQFNITEDEIYKEIQKYLFENKNNVYQILKEDLCSKEEYNLLINYK